MVDRTDFYDAELSRQHRHLLAAMQVNPREHVLDIGCGAGQTSRDAAVQAASVLGVDISADMILAARKRSADSELRNVTFEIGDAQKHDFATAHFDLCISRFGVMFFDDTAAAFANIGKAMRPGGRIVWMVWQSQDRNQWANAFGRALASVPEPNTQSSPAFSLGDRATTTKLLRNAGFDSIDFAEISEPVFYGASVDAAFEALIELQFAGVDRATEPAKQRLNGLLSAHLTSDGVLFDSNAWIITARYESSSDSLKHK